MASVRGRTFPELLALWALQEGRRGVAFRYKKRGVWWDCSWREYWEKSSALAQSLRRLGVKKGERVLLLGPNALERYFLEMACYLAGAVVISVRGFGDGDELLGVLRENDVRWAIVRGEEETELLVEARERYSGLREVIFWNYKGMSRFSYPWLLGMDQLMEGGEGSHEGYDQTAEEPCCLVYSSGATGRPKSYLFSAQSLLQKAWVFVDREKIGHGDILMPFLPSVRIVDKHFGFGVHLLSGCTLALPEREETYLQDLREVRPTVLYFTSRVWEWIFKEAKARVGEGGALKRRMVLRSLSLDGAKRSFLWDYLVYRPLKKRMGLDRLRRAYTIGPLMAGEVYSFYSLLGIPLRRVYWNSEIGLISVSEPTLGPWDMGKVFPGIEVRGEGGRLVVGSGSSQEVNTGDVGEVEGDLVILWGREGEVFSEGGQKVSLQILESRLRTEEFVGDVFFLKAGDDLCAIVIPEPEALSRWARVKGLQFTSFSDLLSKEEVIDLYREIILRQRDGLPGGRRIKGFCLLSNPTEAREYIALNGHWKRGAFMDRLKGVVAAFREGAKGADTMRISFLEEG